MTNTGASPASVTIEYFALDGAPIAVTQLGPIPPNSMAFDYLTGTGGQVAQAVITSSEPIVVSVAAVKYAGGGEDVGQALSYMAVNSSLGSGILVAPFFEKAGGGGNDTSGLQLFNPTNGPTDLEVAFRQPNGATTHHVFTGLPARGAATFYAPSIDALPPGFQGTVHVFAFNSAITGIVNDVNYDVQADGSTSYNVASAHRTSRADFGPSTDLPNNIPAVFVVQYLDEAGKPPLPKEVRFVLDASAFGMWAKQSLNDATGKAIFELPPANGQSGTVTVCVDSNLNFDCDADEPRIVQPYSWSP